MIRPLFRPLLSLVCALAPLLANATVGGPETIELLGEADQRLYLVRRGAYAQDAPPIVYVYDLRSPWPVARVDPISRQGELGQVDAAIEELKSRLKPLTRIEPETVRVTVTARGREPGPFTSDQAHCEVLDVHLGYGRRARTFREYAWPGARGVHAAAKTSTGHVIAVYRSIGVTFESGYELDTPVLLPPPDSPAPPARPWTAACKRTTACTVQLGDEIVIQAAPGTLRCAESARWLGCLWQGRSRRSQHRGWFVDRATGDLRAFGVTPEWGWRIDGPPTIEGNSMSYRIRDAKGKRLTETRLLPPIP